MNLLEAWRRAPTALRPPAIAAVALALSLLLPWYGKSYVPAGARAFVTDDLSAFGVFSFVEAAILLVAAGVLALVWLRALEKRFELPGGDGAAIALAGGWVLALLAWRLFDRPDAGQAGTTIGLQWGIAVTLAAAVALLAAGLRARASRARPRPDTDDDTLEWESASPGARPAGRAPRAHADVTEALRERPSWRGEPPE